MAFDKKQLKDRINSLPLFEKRVVKVKDNSSKDKSDWTEQDKFAICEEGGTVAYSFVSPNYQLVQFKDVFNPIIDSINEELMGYLISHGGFAMLKIFPEIDSLKEGNDQFGLIAMNSVDCSSAIIVKFCVKHKDMQFSIPPTIAGLKKQHFGAAAQITKDYISMIGKVKAVWKRIVTEFPKYEVILDQKYYHGTGQILEFGTVVSQLNLGKRLTKKIRTEYESLTAEGKKYTLWDIFVKVIEEISEGKHKSDVHRERKVDRICKAIFTYSMALSI